MATSKVTNCFSKLSVKEFDTIEAAATTLAESKGRTKPINQDYAEVVQGIIGAKQSKLKSITAPVVQRPSEGSVQQIAQGFIESFGENAPPVHVVPNAKGVIPNADGTEKGAHYKGAIYIFSDNVRSAIDTARTLWHETFHYGLRKLFNREQFVAHMHNLYNRDAFIKEQADEWVATDDGKAVAAAEGMDYAIARGVDEALANLGETNGGKYNKNGILDRAYRTVLSWLADLSESLGAKTIAAAIRGKKNQEARAFIQDVFARTKAGEGRAFNLQDSAQFSKAAQPTDASNKVSPPSPLSAKLPTNVSPGLLSAKATVDLTRKFAGPTAASVVHSAAQTVKSIARSTLFLHDVVDRYKDKVKSLPTWYDWVNKAQQARTKMERAAEEIVALGDKIKDRKAAHSFIEQSTLSQKWGYKPAWKDGVTVDPAMAAKWNALTPEARKFIDAMFKHGYDSKKEERRIIEKLGLDADKFGSSAAEMQGPYAPLKRFGEHVAILKSAALVAAEADAKAGVKGAQAAVSKLKESGKDYVMRTFDTAGQANEYAHANDKANGGTFTFTDSFAKDSSEANSMHDPKYDTLQQVMVALKMTDADAKSKAAMEKMVKDMWMRSLEEHNARLSNQHRKGYAGFEEDMSRAFLTNARARANFLSNLEHGGEISQAFREVQEQAKNKLTGKREFKEITDLIGSHYADMLDYKDTPVQDMVVSATSAWQLATSVGYHVTNLMQPIMSSVPQIAADFGDYSGAFDALLRGYKLLGQVGFVMKSPDISAVKDPKVKSMLQAAADAGLLDTGLMEDLSHLDAFRTGVSAVDDTTSVARSALHKLRQVSRSTETMNRVATAYAAYDTAIKHKKSQAEAEAYAISVLRYTQGDSSRMAKPLLLKKLPKIIGQYRGYQLMMAGLYARAWRQAFYGASPEEKAIGRRMLAYKLGHASLAAGALGLPMMSLVGSAMSMAFGDDDEPYDLERSLREKIGDKDIANLLLHGPLSYIGLDMSSKLGEDKIFSLFPYTDLNFSSKRDALNSLAGMAGPGVAQGLKMADGAGLMGQGDYYAGIEKMLPKGLSDGMKAFRITNDGYTLRNGDVFIKPDEINSMSLWLDAMGLPSSEMKRMDWIRSQQYEIDQFYTDRSKEITRNYVRAHKDGDTDTMAKMREEWQQLQGGKDQLRFMFGDSQDALKKQPLSTLIKSPFNAEKREAKTQKAAQAAY